MNFKYLIIVFITLPIMFGCSNEKPTSEKLNGFDSETFHQWEAKGNAFANGPAGGGKSPPAVAG